MSRAAKFLDRFRTIERSTSPLSLFADDAEGFAAAVAEDPVGLGEVLEIALGRVEGSTADVVAGSFASAACDADGRIVVADTSFRRWLEVDDEVQAAVRPPARGEPHLALIVSDRSGRPAAIASGDRAAAAHWPLDDAVREALEAGRGAFAVLAFRPDAAGWSRATRAHGLTPAESRLVTALATHGDLQEAAANIGIAYETARKLLASAMDRTGAARQTDLVRAVMRLAAGDLRTPGNVDRLFAELFALTLRQAQVARILAGGVTRSQAARAMGISEHAVKADLKHVYVACGVVSAVDLARIVAEVDALAGLATACDIVIDRANEQEHLRIVPRQWAPGHIALVDHGPPGGSPVIILHSTTMGRAISARFVAALQAAGLRPIIFDRAGFGLTDFVEGDPTHSFARDAETVLDALGCPAAILLSRAMAMSAVTAAALLPERFGGGVLLNPEPPAALDRNLRGMMGAARTIFYRQPWLAERVARLLSQRTDSQSIARLIRESVAGSEIDLRALDDPEDMAIAVRSGRQCALGMRGFLNEMTWHASGNVAAPLSAGERWIIQYGENDPLYAFADGEAYWSKTLPGASINCVNGGGRYLHLTHPDEVAMACAQLILYAGD